MTFNFLFWSFRNQDKFRERTDYKIAISRLLDITTNNLIIIGACFVFHRFLRRLDSPFLNLYMEDKFVTLPTIKKVACFGIGIYSISNNLRNELK